MIVVNLLPDVKQEYLRAKRTKAQVISIATIVTIGAAGLVLLLASWVYIGQPLQKKHYTDEIKKNSSKMRNIADLDKYLTLQNQLDNLSPLHSSKNDFSRLMRYLPKLNPAAPNNVKLTNIELKAVEGKNSLVLKGETKDYTSLNIFRDTLRTAKLRYKGDGDKQVDEQLFKTIDMVSSLDKSTGGGQIVSFQATLDYNPNAFLNSIKSPDAVVADANTTASVEAAPDVFGKSTKQEGQ